MTWLWVGVRGTFDAVSSLRWFHTNSFLSPRVGVESGVPVHGTCLQLSLLWVVPAMGVPAAGLGPCWQGPPSRLWGRGQGEEMEAVGEGRHRKRKWGTLVAKPSTEGLLLQLPGVPAGEEAC